ncbi:hypothetical protein SAMN04487894_108181 [Niabella drilacis]|uniref:Uncharacterized protein n=1 Tax=Niabella drilacis (strain DSM 25811 / CCM 8410 / CCUG 62505 / LMG 26954 / E90) TaxID=1285928 RepID=A0A1G6U884_NIADE|nr:hypothetical protein SAMN04487894_108181 [Niabella drilacis]
MIADVMIDSNSDKHFSHVQSLAAISLHMRATGGENFKRLGLFF